MEKIIYIFELFLNIKIYWNIKNLIKHKKNINNNNIIMVYILFFYIFEIFISLFF